MSYIADFSNKRWTGTMDKNKITHELDKREQAFNSQMKSLGLIGNDFKWPIPRKYK